MGRRPARPHKPSTARSTLASATMPTRPRSRCTKCRRLFAGVGRCPACDTRKASRYDATYRRARNELLEQQPLCALRLPGCTAWATTADHVDGRSSDRLRPSCAHCNSVDGAARSR